MCLDICLCNICPGDICLGDICPGSLISGVSLDLDNTFASRLFKTCNDLAN